MQRAQGLAARSLYVRCHPSPRTLTERMEVLNELQKHGTVEHFRNLKHHPTNPDPSAFHLILFSASTSKALLSLSPLPFSPISAPRTLHISHSYHDHPLAIRSSPLYGPYAPVPESRSPIASALKTRVPESIASNGLCDWVTDSPRERRGWMAGLGGGEDRTPWRIRRRERERLVAERGEGGRAVGRAAAGVDVEGEDVGGVYEHWGADDNMDAAEQAEMERDGHGGGVV